MNKWETSKLIKLAAAGGIIVLALGISSLGKGNDVSSAEVAVIGDGIQNVAIALEPNSYAPIVVQKGVPVRFNIVAKENDINGCNGTVIIPEYGIELPLKAGDNIIEFTPAKAGDIGYSCWMGMIRSNIKVVDKLNE